MKKILIYLCIFAVLLVGCAKKPPVEMTPAQKAQNKLVEIGEGYLNYDIKKEDAIQTIESMIFPQEDALLYKELVICVELLKDQIAFGTQGSYEKIENLVDYIKNKDFSTADSLTLIDLVKTRVLQICDFRPEDPEGFYPMSSLEDLSDLIGYEYSIYFKEDIDEIDNAYFEGDEWFNSVRQRVENTDYCALYEEDN